MEDLAARLRAANMRLTSPRERIVRAVAQLGHATPEAVLARLAADGGDEVPASTVYRSLDALEQAGVVRHTHLDHRAPSYQLAEHGEHIHLVCRGCGAVDEVPEDVATALRERILTDRGFAADLTHAAIHGRCPQCQ